MADPATNTCAGIAYATGAISICGSFLGLQYDGLLFGLFGGLISLMHLPPMGLKRLAGTLSSASVLGSVFGPGAAALALSMGEWVKVIPAESLQHGCILGIGMFAQWLIPLVLARIATKQQEGA